MSAGQAPRVASKITRIGSTIPIGTVRGQFLESDAVGPNLKILGTDETGGAPNGRLLVDGISDRPPPGLHNPAIATRPETIVRPRILNGSHAAAGVEASESTIFVSAAGTVAQRIRKETLARA